MTTNNNQNDKPWLFKKGGTPWNLGSGGCTRGHDPSQYQAGPSGTKVCLECKRENGAKYRRKNEGRLTWMKRARNYGMSIAELDNLFNSQRGKCKICGYIFTDGDYHIDHDHDTGAVRGLLCTSCNTGIGLFKDSPDLLKNTIQYLIDNGRSYSEGETASPPTIKIHRIKRAQKDY